MDISVAVGWLLVPGKFSHPVGAHGMVLGCMAANVAHVALHDGPAVLGTGDRLTTWTDIVSRRGRCKTQRMGLESIPQIMICYANVRGIYLVRTVMTTKVLRDNDWTQGILIPCVSVMLSMLKPKVFPWLWVLYAQGTVIGLSIMIIF